MGTFYNNGTTNTAQVTIGTSGDKMTLFQNTYGALWARYNGFDATTYKATQGYMGKLMNQFIPNAASLLAPFFNLPRL